MISEFLKKTYTELHKTTPFGKRAKFPKELAKFINIQKTQWQDQISLIT